jgi:predicted SnoaL-like aldol condensation-catalyzing enzyme
MKHIKHTLLFAIASLTFMTSCNQNAHDRMHAKVDSLKTELKNLQAKIDEEESNKKLVADFYQQLFGDKNIESIDKYLTEGYIQHNPGLPDGRAALKEAVTQWFKGAPQEKVDIQHLSADGDLVYIHTKTKMGPKTVSIIDIFRVDHGKIAEHWDVIQEVPEKSANAHPMF